MTRTGPTSVVCECGLTMFDEYQPGDDSWLRHHFDTCDDHQAAMHEQRVLEGEEE